MKKCLKNKKGFTLIELLVVVAIIGLLSSIVFASLNTARAKARDAKRKEDFEQLRTALAMYYNDNNGQYPASGSWRGNCPTWGNYSTSGATGYIPNLAPTYIPVLPLDPNPTPPTYCYIYYSDGNNYKILMYSTWEESYPSVGSPWYDPVRPTYALMLCSGDPTACNTW